VRHKPANNMADEKAMDVESTISTEAELDTLRDGVDDPVVLKEQLKKESNARRQLTARAKRAEDERKAAQREAEELRQKYEKSSDKNITNQSPTLNISDDVVDLRLDGYSKDEVAFILANGGRKALEDKNSYVSIAINTRREQLNAERQASKVQDTGNLSEIERKYTKEQLANMSVKELESILPHA